MCFRDMSHFVNLLEKEETLIPLMARFFQTLIFTGDKLEAYFATLNELGANGTQPVGLVTYTLFALDPEISPTDVRFPCHLLDAETDDIHPAHYHTYL